MRRQPRTLLVGLAVAIAASVLAACGSSGDPAGGAKSLVIGGWGSTIDKATRDFYLAPFEEETGISAKFDDAPGTQVASLQAQSQAGKVTWDAMDSVSGEAAYTLAAKGMLAPLPRDLKARLVKELGAEKVTEFGFAHLNLGNVVVCNMDKMSTCPKDMVEFFNTTKFPQSRMFGGIEPSYAATAAQLASGVPAEEMATRDVDIDSVISELNRIKPKVRVFWQSGDQQEQIMRSGEVDMGIMWSGRAYRLLAEGMNVQIKWAGGVYEPSYWAVPKDAPHKAEAFKLLEWIATHPEAQAKLAESLHYSVPHPEARKSMSKDLVRELADTPSNLDQLVVPNLAWYAEHSQEFSKAYQNYLRG